MCCKENLLFERICFMLQTDWNGKPYHSLDYELKKVFGKKVYKLALDGGMTCPNRDGTLGKGGCIFCSAGGSGDFAEKQAGSLREQADLAKPASAGRSQEMTLPMSRISSHTQTHMPHSPIWNSSFLRQSPSRRSAHSPSAHGRTACRMKP